MAGTAWIWGISYTPIMCIRIQGSLRMEKGWLGYPGYAGPNAVLYNVFQYMRITRVEWMSGIAWMRGISYTPIMFIRIQGSLRMVKLWLGYPGY